MPYSSMMQRPDVDGLAGCCSLCCCESTQVVSMKSGGNAGWSEIGRTEVVANNLSPRFVTLIPAVRESQLFFFRMWYGTIQTFFVAGV